MREFPSPVFISAPAFPQRVPCSLQALTNHLAGNPVLLVFQAQKQPFFL